MKLLQCIKIKLKKSTFSRFLLVGGWNFLFGYSAFAWLYNILSPICHETIIIIFSSFLGITNSFLTHRWLTYRSNGVWWKEYFRFYIVYIGQILLNILLATLLVSFLGFNAYIIQFVILLLLTIFSYWGHKLFSFKSNSKRRSE